MAVRFRPVLSPVGFIVLAVSFFLLIRALIIRNSYEIVISFVILLLLLILFITGMWKSRKLKNMECGWKPPFPMTASLSRNRTAEAVSTVVCERTQITGLDASIPLFFRLHFLVSGRFFANGGVSSMPVSVEISVARNDTSAQMLLDFPISGVFNAEGICLLRDIFGFFAFRCGQPQVKTVNVRSAPCFGKKTHINAQSGAEDKRNKPASDIERYHMREYTPGDRFRDINWKSSEKIDTLITRISTDNQEKICRIEVHFRNYYFEGIGRRGIFSGSKNSGSGKKMKKKREISAEAHWLLDRAKARLAYFLRTLMEQNPAFIFDVRTAGADYEIEDMDDLDEFLEALAGFSFQPPQNETSSFGEASRGTQNTGEMYVFSTACDFGLPSFLLANSQRTATIFILQPSDKTKKDEVEYLRISDFSSNGCMPSARWLTCDKINPLRVHTNKTEMFYAEVKL